MKTLFAAAVAVSLLTGTMAAYAGDDRDHGRHERREERHDKHRNERHDWNRHNDHRNDWQRHNDHRNDWNRHHGNRNDWNRHNDHRNDWNRHNDHRNNWHHNNNRHDWNDRDYRAGYFHGRADQRRYDRGRYIPPRGYYAHSWRRGDHLPRAYCGSSYIVRDYHVYHLNAPPHGHHWVRVNNDVVLAAVASGLVVSVVSGLFF